MITINNIQISEEELVRLVKDNKELMDKITQVDKTWPKEGDTYYYNSLYAPLKICSVNYGGTGFDQEMKEIGNMFKTKEEAAQALDKQKAKVRIINRIKELNDSVGWVCDWSDGSQDKSYLYYNSVNKMISSTGIHIIHNHSTEFYFSREVVDQVVKDCGEDYKIYLGLLQLISVK